MKQEPYLFLLIMLSWLPSTMLNLRINFSNSILILFFFIDLEQLFWPLWSKDEENYSCLDLESVQPLWASHQTSTGKLRIAWEKINCLPFCLAHHSLEVLLLVTKCSPDTLVHVRILINTSKNVWMNKSKDGSLALKI